MRAIFKQPLRNYVIGLFMLISIMGIILWTTHSNIILFGATLGVLFIIIVLIFMHVLDKYVKPLDPIIETVHEMVQGHYVTRVQQQASGKAGELSKEINILAQNLNELSTNEQIQKEQLSTIINNTESGIVLINEKGYIHFVNRKFINMFGQTTKHYHGYLYYDVLRYEEIHQVVQDIFLHEKNIKAFFAKKDHLKTSYIEVLGAPIFDENNRFKGSVLVLYDITDFKKLENMRKDFVANVSHELKTPITSIKGFAETLANGAIHNEERREEFVQIIYDESSRLQLLIEDLLTLSRLEHDGFYLHISDTDMVELVESIRPMIALKAEEKSINLNINVEDVQADLDRKKVKQVILNLLNNAINYTADKGEVSLEVTHEEKQLYIIVRDNGIGIDQELIPRLFERFYRVDQARSRNTGGTGLGLAIVKHIVELHDGHIEIDSQLGEGSSFTIMLPIERTSE
ncbi:MAG TPA: PAS domain S-box protein [Candidatus Avamphibacillus intestinigallinarum]|nr:PAS domain S-box protein [Candidatus Avamphibacillus intestinigallinarum]